MKNVFGYLRKSSRSQADNEGFPRQRAAIESFCAARGWHVLRWFLDDAVSGTIETDGRDGFAEMLSLMGPSTTDTIVIESADRLARDLMVSELACEDVRNLKFHIFEAACGNELTDSSDPTRVMLRQFLGVLAQWNKSMMVKRMRDAKDRIRTRTGRCEGRRGFGYQSIQDAETLELIMSFKATGLTFRAVADELNRRKRTTPENKGGWKGSSVFYIWQRTEKVRRSEARPAHAKNLLNGLPV